MNKTSKKCLSVLLSLMMIFSMFGGISTTSFAASVDGLTYEINNGEVTIKGCDDNASGDLVIPNTVDGYPVTAIGENAFQRCEGLTSVTIGDSVTTIGEWAFVGCSGLTDFSVSEVNENYSSDAYGVLFNKDKTSLIQYPTGNERKEYTIPDSVTTIEKCAFALCSGLTSVTIGNSVTTIGDSAFFRCDKLTSVTIPNSVTTIGDHAFHRCSGLTSVTIPNSVTMIGGYAFYQCSGLTSVTIPDSVTTIKECAFNECTGLTSVTIPNSVTTIEVGAFEECSNLSDVYFYGTEEEWNAIDIANGYDEGAPFLNATIHFITNSVGDLTYKINNGEVTITGCDKNASGELVIPETIEGYPVTAIGTNAFYWCEELTSVTIPNSVTTIGDSAFYSCSGLTSITIPDSVTTIGDCAFFWCEGLTSITIPDSVTTIGIEKLESYCKDGYVYFKTNHFSVYAIVEESKNADNDGFNLNDIIKKIIQFFRDIIAFIQNLFGNIK